MLAIACHQAVQYSDVLTARDAHTFRPEDGYVVKKAA